MSGRRVDHQRFEYADGLVGLVERRANRLRRGGEALTGRGLRVPRRLEPLNRVSETLQRIGRQPARDERLGVQRDAIEESPRISRWEKLGRGGAEMSQ